MEVRYFRKRKTDRVIPVVVKENFEDRKQHLEDSDWFEVKDPKDLEELGYEVSVVEDNKPKQKAKAKEDKKEQQENVVDKDTATEN